MDAALPGIGPWDKIIRSPALCIFPFRVAQLRDARARGGKCLHTSLVTNPAPVSVYRSERYGTFTYTVSGLTASNAYTVNLHFTEDYWTAAGRRLENVSIWTLSETPRT
jgi:hypothetical protein